MDRKSARLITTLFIIQCFFIFKALKEHIESFLKAELFEGNIILFTLSKDIKIELDDMMEAARCQDKLAYGNPFHAIIDMRYTQNTMSKASSKYGYEYELNTPTKLSQSVIVDSVGKSFLLGILRLTNVSHIPFKTFNTIEECLTWIEELENENSELKN